jgi:hypothetical protein
MEIMSNQTILEVNRSAFIIAPKQAFFDMLAPYMEGQVYQSEEITVNDSSTVYLVSAEFFGIDEAMEYLHKNFRTIFEHEIEGWITDPDMWPKKVTWKQFKDWFFINFQSMVVDMEGDEPLYEEL